MRNLRTAVYYFPNYHVDPRNEKIHGENWTEWELMKCARPRFPGHDQPKIPLWGYEDEADPAVMSKKIDTAFSYGHNAFIFDWYWYDGPFLNRALDEGFLKCGNTKMEFCLMWANHHWTNIHPCARSRPHPVDFFWSTTKGSIGFVWDYLIEHYFSHPLYMKIDGRPFFSIYAVNDFIRQMGGRNEAAEVLADLRNRVKKAGLPGIFINANWVDNLNEQSATICPTEEWKTFIGFDSYANYNMLAYTFRIPGKENTVSYEKVLEYYLKICHKAQQTLPALYFPEVTVGWDSSPRTVQSESYSSQLGYPYLRIMEPTEETLYQATCQLGATLENFPENSRILFFNAWNEWTEGSYLEPDLKHGFAYLKAIKKGLDQLRSEED